MIPIVIGGIGIVTKRLEKRLEELEIRTQVEPSKRQHGKDRPEHRLCENSQRSKMIIIIIIIIK